MITNKAYFKELISQLKKKPLTERQISRIKMDLCKKYKVKYVPTNIHVLLNADQKDLDKLKYLQTKPTRTISGVSVVALMTKPFHCPHAKSSKSKLSKSKKGPCIFCPGGPKSKIGDVPQSYTGNEPSTMRGIRNKFDSYLSTMNRLEQYVVLGHNFDKIELIVMGGTFNAFPKKYQEEFVMYSFKALNDFSKLFFDAKGKFNVVKFRKFFLLPGVVGDAVRTKKIHRKLLELKKKGKPSLLGEQKKNEKAKIRCVGLTLETRPDCIDKKTANEMLRLGATRVELGVQSVYDDVLDFVKRGHGVDESINATKLLKDLGFKINYHLMPGLPDKNGKIVSMKKDLAGLKEIFANSDFRPDMLKLYPCMVMPGTKLFQLWKKGKFKALKTEKATELIAEFKKYVPVYCRIQRVQRDIPSYMAEDGVDKTNLRQYVDALMKKHEKEAKVKGKNKCRCIRCREAGHVFRKFKQIPDQKNVKLIVRGYEASEGVEWFISFEDTKQDILLGFCRLRLPARDLVDIKNKKEITNNIAFIRELHVVGEAIEIGATKIKGKKPKLNIQHKGLGKQLIKEAENIAKQFCKKKMIVISGIGARDYYRKLGYKKEGVYMVKTIK
ncbi:tRNA uridine(34) 5-carboxymethylaminomethyl modification radical SAM/GNAT enzyme Elp3 [Candidatus Woesearchaeota archaeon]|jgi:elongator complex protein 3|nr:tRNA uridine(34) 5-carboxymethylaminomethyl modification radical SAM/GNAT enzyme Elp3 [Candidatus Woesearchaeota archaeon]MBT6337430.1 tRNA uridine(34) 5-carboxymethylaminomethyl modification radical SAM/GNAT enzyme Elp3 [Candidatus Woesearchaeota archaeon]